MAGIVDEFMEQLSGGDVGGIETLASQVFGDAAGSDAAQSAVGTSVGAIVGGLAHNAVDTGGSQQLLDALGQHDGSVIQHVASDPSVVDTDDGAKILGHVFGENQQAVVSQLAGKSGMDVGTITKLLPVLAPLVMSFLGQKSRDGELDAGGLAGMLDDARGGLDLGDLADVFLGGGGSGGSGSGGGLGSILGKLKGLLGGR